MEKKEIFWMLAILCVVLGAVGMFPTPVKNGMWKAFGVVLFVLICLLGWKVYGPAIT